METPQIKTTRILDAQGIAYRVLPHAAPVFTVADAAAARGVAAAEMVKSLLLRERGGRYVMACVTGAARLDLQAVRACLPPDWKRLQFATAAEIAAVTGYPQGAVNPIGLPAAVPVIMDVAVAACAQVNISRGDPLAGLELDPHDLIRVTGARLAAIAAAA